MLSQKVVEGFGKGCVVDGFGRNLVGRLGVCEDESSDWVRPLRLFRHVKPVMALQSPDALLRPPKPFRLLDPLRSHIILIPCRP